MSFLSIAFLALLIIVVPLYYILPKKARWVLLLAASCVFYAYFNAYLILLLAVTVLISYSAGLAIDKARQKSVKKTVMIISVILLLGILVFFKYVGFLADTAVSICNLFGASLSKITINIILPVGISFYTFQTLSYIIDVYRGTIKPERHLGYYALFVSYFPQLVAGPIEKAKNLLPQFYADHKFDFTALKEGLVLMAAGFFKKAVVADIFAIIVNSVYNATEISSLTGLSVLFATALFFVQIYCDFSGYSDIAIGCSRLFGIKLMANFDKPFGSQSITEFWSRWHISLNDWFNCYVYMPLAFRSIGKHNLALRNCLNVFIVACLCGLWHGASWNYVIWGVLVGLYQCVEILTRKRVDIFYKKRNIDKNGKVLSALRKIRTYVIMLLPLLFFRANTTKDAFSLIGVLFTGWSFQTGYFGKFIAQTGLTAFTAVAVAVLPFVLKFIDDGVSDIRKDIVTTKKPVAFGVQFIYIVWLVILSVCFLYESGRINQFIYFRF